MLCVETVGRIRRLHFVDGRSIKEIARLLKVSRNTVRRVIRSEPPALTYARTVQPRPQLGAYATRLEEMLDAEERLPARQRRRTVRLYEALRFAGYAGKDDSVYRFVKLWREERARRSAAVFIPLVFAAGEAYQFDWSYETVELDGEAVTVKVAHFRLCHSRHYFVRAYLREAQEQVFDAHNRAFAFFGGLTRRGIYDNLKTCVDAVLRGKDRSFNARFLQLCNHYLLEPTACTPAAGWEKGQVENQVNEIRQRLFRPRPKFADLATFNAWLESQCTELAQRRAHPEQRGRSVWEVYQEERAALRSLPTPFPSYREIDTRASTTSLVRFDANRYSVDCRVAGRPVTLRADAERVVIVHGETVVADHPRSFDRYQTIYEPWHYLPALSRKPGALRNGAPFVDWSLPAPLTDVRRKLERHGDGDRQFVAILHAVAYDGLPAVEAACREALASHSVSADVVLALLARARDPAPPASLAIPQALVLAHEPDADCSRYNRLLRMVLPCKLPNCSI
ncbi:MAG: IS21 family transposase [Proteobacteria bacterium]|nr:IS21 family transposase [Pseudomonadota bacterium]